MDGDAANGSTEVEHTYEEIRKTLLFALFLIKMQNCQIWRFGHIWDRNSGNPVSKITMEELNSAPIRPVSDSFQEYEIPNRLIN